MNTGKRMGIGIQKMRNCENVECECGKRVQGNIETIENAEKRDGETDTEASSD